MRSSQSSRPRSYDRWTGRHGVNSNRIRPNGANMIKPAPLGKICHFIKDVSRRGDNNQAVSGQTVGDSGAAAPRAFIIINRCGGGFYIRDPIIFSSLPGREGRAKASRNARRQPMGKMTARTDPLCLRIDIRFLHLIKNFICNICTINSLSFQIFEVESGYSVTENALIHILVILLSSREQLI